MENVMSSFPPSQHEVGQVLISFYVHFRIYLKAVRIAKSNCFFVSWEDEISIIRPKRLRFLVVVPKYSGLRYSEP